MKQTNTIFTIAVESDVASLSGLLSILFEQEADFTPSGELQERGLKLILQDESIGHILVAKVNGMVIGMVNLLYSVSTALGAKVATVEDMVVHPSFRTKGVGTALLSYAKSFAVEQEVKRLTLLTDADNFEAHRFYNRLGFSSSEMIPFRIVFDGE